MDIAKQIIDQRINKILEDNQEIFTDNDNERNRSKAFLLLGAAAYLDIELQEQNWMVKMDDLQIIYGG